MSGDDTVLKSEAPSTLALKQDSRLSRAGTVTALDYEPVAGEA